jgi:hypothetical protein
MPAAGSLSVADCQGVGSGRVPLSWVLIGGFYCAYLLYHPMIPITPSSNYGTFLCGSIVVLRNTSSRIKPLIYSECLRTVNGKRDSHCTHCALATYSTRTYPRYPSLMPVDDLVGDTKRNVFQPRVVQDAFHVLYTWWC